MFDFRRPFEINTFAAVMIDGSFLHSVDPFHSPYNEVLFAKWTQTSVLLSTASYLFITALLGLVATKRNS